MFDKIIEKFFNKVEKEKKHTYITIYGKNRDKYNHDLIIEHKDSKTELNNYFKHIKGLKTNTIF